MMDHVFDSRWLVNELSRLGFSISYDEVNRYKLFIVKALIVCLQSTFRVPLLSG